MVDSLLATKIRIPVAPPQSIPRARLVDALEGGVPDFKLTLLSAPAGYGKTTLLAQWARASELPVAWLSIGEGDNDLERFLRYLLMAWEAVQPGVRESPLALLLDAMSPEMEAVLAAFINVASETGHHTVFVLDDYHLIDDPAIHQALTFLLDHLPPTIHFILAGRAEPPLPLARYRMRRELWELRAEDLSFLPSETTEFLNEMMGLELTPDEILRLQSRVEGWVAGLQLVALTLQRRLAGADRLIIGGRHRFIADYLDEDVLAPLPDSIRHFLLRTSILERLSGSLCDAVTGKEGGQEMLEILERENLFLVPLDDSREWFRYHHLFADFLREELNRRHPEQIPDLHLRAAEWYLEHDLSESAFYHAVAGDAPDLVIRIFERYTHLMLNAGELKLVKRWLDALPASWYATHPLLTLFRAVVLGYTGAFDACLRCIDEVEQRLAPVESEETRWQRAMVGAIRCFMACIQNDLAEAERHADEAFRGLREESLSFRAAVYHALGDTYRRHGRWSQASECYRKVLTFTDTPGFHVHSTHAFGALADLELSQGSLRRAAHYWREALAAIREKETRGRLPLPVTGWVYIRMGEILYEWNELEAAGDHVSQGLERAELGGDIRARIAGYLLAGRLRLATGDIVEAVGYLERLRPLVESARFPEWIARFERLQLECWLAQERLRAAVDWADAMLRGDEAEERPGSEVARLALARVLIVKGDASSVARALPLLERLIERAETEGRTGTRIEALALESLAHWRRGDWTGALTRLELALRLAEPEGYLRLFVDLGLPMARVLQEARSRDIIPGYTEKILAAFDDDFSTFAPAQAALPEPLTSREQEVLELMAAGLTNREIASELVISPETVKKHAGSVYAKLSARSRTEAVTLARKMGLLD